jgi:hypothetical protein
VLLTVQIRRESKHPEGASRCPKCGAVMPLFTGVEATVGAESTEVLITKMAFSVSCPCGTPVVLTLEFGYRILRSDAEGSMTKGGGS